MYGHLSIRMLLAAVAKSGIASRHFETGDIEAIPETKGAYALLLRLDDPLDLSFRKTRTSRIEPGWFVYCGSANGPGGLRARLRRHVRRDKRLHWHVDQLTIAAAEIVSIPVPGGDECDLVERLLRQTGFDIAVRDFGNSDCTSCQSHLLRFSG